MKPTQKARGNRAKIDPRKKISPEYVTNAVTAKDQGSLYSDDGNVEQARDFSEENER